jgi:hypothetical protein
MDNQALTNPSDEARWLMELQAVQARSRKAWETGKPITPTPSLRRRDPRPSA